MKIIIKALSITAALALVGCSSTAPVETSPTVAAPASSAATVETPMDTEAAVGPAADGKPLAYQFVSMGNATVLFDLPADVADKRLVGIETFRKDVGAAPVSYIIADVDNRDGLESVNMYKVSAYDADGKEYEFTAVSEMIAEWGPSYTEEYVYVLPDGTKLDEATGTALSARGTTLHNENIDNIDKSQRGVIILASTSVDLPSEFVRVGVQPSGMGEQQDAFLVSEAFGD